MYSKLQAVSDVKIVELSDHTVVDALFHCERTLLGIKAQLRDAADGDMRSSLAGGEEGLDGAAQVVLPFNRRVALHGSSDDEAEGASEGADDNAVQRVEQVGCRRCNCPPSCGAHCGVVPAADWGRR